MKNNIRISEAPESNAGDNFHVLWTIKKSFELLNFEDNGLKAITIEGIDPLNPIKSDPLGNQLLGVDIVEYYGGEHFNEARKIVISQLKYSTRHASKNWTFSSLYKGKKSNSTDGSILHRLAQIYKSFLKEYGRDLVLKKIVIKLVSNRNFNKLQKQLILNIQKYLDTKKDKTDIKTLYTKFPNNKSKLSKLRTATKLNTHEFTDFLRLLNLDDCGTRSSYYQEIEIINSISNVGINNSSQFDSLFRMVWKKMLPDAIDGKENKINEIDLLNCLQTSMEQLFPVVQKFEKIDNLVDREQVKDIKDVILDNKTQTPICLHGGAGIGKSIFVQLIKEAITNDSEVILFDCYGAGAYLNTSDSRHLHKEALLQISNEMAKKIGSPFLISKDNDKHILIRDFKTRVEKSIQILQKRNANSLLILIVDAADNSITAALKNQTKSFIEDLLSEPMPKGFRLVVTSRSSRILSLNLPNNYIDIPLAPFNFHETKVHLTHFFPKSTIAEVNQFLKLTNGVPRVQSYVLELKKSGINEIINYLKPNGKIVNDLIQDKIFEASKKLGNQGENIINIFFKYLITLPRPVPLSFLCKLSGLNEDLVKDLSTDIWHGLILNNNQLSFRDEDFENFIRDKYKPEGKILKRIADLFLLNANDEEYASINLGIALYDADYKKKLIDIVLNEDFNSLPINPIRKKEVYIERTKLAMKVCEQTEDNLTFFKLTFIAAEVAKTDDALKNLLISNADLVASFGDLDSLQRLNLQSQEKSWAGSFHYQLAAIHSRNSDSVEIAKMHLKYAEKWLQWSQGQKDIDIFDRYQINEKDIAYGAEAYLRIYGAKVVFNWLKRWSPGKMIFYATNKFLDNVLKYSKDKQIFDWLISVHLPIYAKIIIINKINLLSISVYNLNDVVERLFKILSKGFKFKIYLFPSIINFCEITIFSKSFDKEQILKLLELVKVRLPDYIPSLMNNPYYDNDEIINIDSYLKKECLKSSLNFTSLTIEEIYPEKFKKNENGNDYKTKMSLANSKNDFDRFYKMALLIYQLRADVFTNNNECNENEYINRFQTVCDSMKNNWDFRYYDSAWVQYKLNFFALILIDAVLLLNKKNVLIYKVISSFENKDENKITLRLAISKKISNLKDLSDCTIKIINEIDELIQNSTLSSNEIVDFYIQSSKITRSLSEQISRFYFNKAIEAVSEIDIEAHEQIKCLYSLTQLGLPKENPLLAVEFYRFIEYSKNRLNGYDHFPIEAGIKGIAHLDCATAFILLCKWDHKYLLNITEYILLVLKISLDKEYITPSIGSSILPINIYYWKSYIEFLKTLVGKFDLIGDSNQKTTFVSNILRDILINSSLFEQTEIIKPFYEIIKDGKYLENRVILNVQKYVQFISNLDINKNKSNDSFSSFNDRNSKEESSMLNLEDIDVTSTSSLNENLNKINLNKNSYLNYPQISEFLITVKKKCKPEMFILHLDAFININPDLLSFHIFEESLKDRLDEWSHNPTVREWKKHNFIKVLKLWFPIFSHSDYIHYEGIKKFADIFSIDDEELISKIISILPEKIDELSATALYQTIAFLGKKINKDENEKLLNWILTRLTSKINKEINPDIFESYYLSLNNTFDVIAYTIRYILGQPDKRLRWRGIHSLIRLINTGNSNILKILLDLQNKKDCIPFQFQDNTFYWISAKLYLWICIVRISIDNPKELIKFKAEIFNELQNTDLPHVLIQYFIKQTCINLKEFDKSIFTDNEFNIITNLLKSKFVPLNESRLEREQGKYNTFNGNLRFKFDNMDTLPYWYSHLGRCFNLSENDVADIADIYISEKWGYTGNAREDNHVHTFTDRDYSLTQNDHGSLPTIETLRIYFEYHSMFCAAHDLLEKEPLLKNKYSWQNWLESNGLAWKEFLMSDLRDPIPLDKRFWQSDYDKFDDNWVGSIEEKNYDEVLGLQNTSNVNHIILYASYTRYFGENHENVSVKSALVSNKTSNALLNALQSAEDYYDYRIPLEGDELQIKEPNFKFIGWLKEKCAEHEGLDTNDPFSNNEGKGFIIFGEEVDKVFKLNYSSDFKKCFYNEKHISTYQNWSNITENKKYNDLETCGSLLEVNISFLLDFLTKKDLSLIIKCNISRHLKDQDYNKWNIIRKKNVKIYLINSNGQVKTIRGRNFNIG